MKVKVKFNSYIYEKLRPLREAHISHFFKLCSLFKIHENKLPTSPKL